MAAKKTTAKKAPAKKAAPPPMSTIELRRQARAERRAAQTWRTA